MTLDPIREPSGRDGESIGINSATAHHPNDGAPAYDGEPVQVDVAKPTSVLDCRSLRCPGFLGFWRFDEGAPNIVTDSSGWNHIATIVEGITADTWPHPSPNFVDGRTGRALKLDGVDDWVRSPDRKINQIAPNEDAGFAPNPTVFTEIATNNSISITAWLWLDHAASGVVLQRRMTGAQAAQFSLGLRGGSVVASIERVQLAATAALPLQQWVFVAMTFEGATLRIYVDGKEAASQNVDCNMVDQDGGDVSMGAAVVDGAVSGFLDATIDDIRLYSVALSDEDLVRLTETIRGL